MPSDKEAASLPFPLAFNLTKDMRLYQGEYKPDRPNDVGDAKFERSTTTSTAANP